MCIVYSCAGMCLYVSLLFPLTHLITHEPLHVCRVFCIYVCLCPPLCVCLIFSALLLSFPPSMFLFFLSPNGRAINQREREGERGGREGGEGDIGEVPGEERLAHCPEKERESKRKGERASSRASQNERRRIQERTSTDRGRQGAKETQRLKKRERERSVTDEERRK